MWAPESTDKEHTANPMASHFDSAAEAFHQYSSATRIETPAASKYIFGIFEASVLRNVELQGTWGSLGYQFLLRSSKGSAVVRFLEAMFAGVLRKRCLNGVFK